MLRECRGEAGRYRMGLAAFRGGRVKEAERALGGEGAGVPGGAFGYLLLGEVMEKMQRYLEAREAYLKALEENPSLWVAYQKLAKFAEGKVGDFMHPSVFQ